MDVGLEPGFRSHEISLALAWNRVPPDVLQSEAHLDGAIGWAIEDQLRLASGRKLVLLGQQLMHVVRTLKDQWFALALGAAALTALLWLELMAS